MVVIQTGIHGHHVLDIVALDFKHVLEVVVILNLLIMALDVLEPVKKLEIVNTVRPAQVCLLIQYILSMRLINGAMYRVPPPPHTHTHYILWYSPIRVRLILFSSSYLAEMELK